jgi:uncharacterized protein
MSFRPPPPQRIDIPGPAGQLEAIVEEPASASQERLAVVLHPHPQFGGTMDNKVVHTLARTLQELGMPTVRFNFRGVGRSEGKFGGGQGEIEDALAVIDWAKQRWQRARPWLAGFSFGGYIALEAAARREVAQLITVAPAVHRFAAAAVAVPRVPWLLIQGDADEVVDAREVVGWARGLQPAPRLVLVEGVGHYFHGRLQDLKEAVRSNLTA